MEPHIRVPLIVLSYLTFVSRFSSGLVGRLHGSVELPCEYHEKLVAKENITAYWQRADLVVATVKNGVVDTTHTSEMFRGRAQVNPDQLNVRSLNLTLTNLSLDDGGTYVCHIFNVEAGPFSPYKSCMVELEVTAEFSTPVVNILSSRKLQHCQEVTFICTSEGGLESPRIMWINTSHGSEVQEGHVHEDVHQDRNVINVTSTITLNVTSNINISCIIVTKDKNLTSSNYEITDLQNDRMTEEKSDPPVLTVSLVIGGLVAVFLIVLPFILRRVHRTPSYTVPANQMSELASG
ncbi:ICOS ligand-like isoform X2 [Eleutherodactylus coqui]|uniref:ICOS ligand-like isoform X2 n=1 Tax=Eleutherodactylus coqui TaxID=57060 RepID=UPI0034636C58